LQKQKNKSHKKRCLFIVFYPYLANLNCLLIVYDFDGTKLYSDKIELGKKNEVHTYKVKLKNSIKGSFILNRFIFDDKSEKDIKLIVN